MAETPKGAMRAVRIEDVSDERRAAKTWLPASDRDVTEGRVVLDGQYPHCVKHGAMNKLSVNANIYRCSECAVGCSLLTETACPCITTERAVCGVADCFHFGPSAAECGLCHRTGVVYV